MERTARILVVDDNEASAKVFALALSIEGYDVRESYEGKQAVAIAQTFVPDVVFLDLGIPFMDGFEIAKAIRESPGLEHVVICAITGYSGDEHVARSRAAGFSRHLIKPVEPEIIRRVLNEMGFSAQPRVSAAS